MVIGCFPFTLLALIYLALFVYSAYRAVPGSRAIRKMRESADHKVRERIPEIPFRTEAGGRPEDGAFTRFIFDREYRDWDDREFVRRVDDMRIFGMIWLALLFVLLPVLAYPEFRGAIVSVLCVK